MATGRLDQLGEALRERRFVRFSQWFQKGWVSGYVLDIEPKFFLLALVSDGIWFDGFQCYQINDLKNVKPDPYAAFVESALKKRGERVPKKPRVDIGSVEKLLVSAGRSFSLVSIHLEEVDPDVCWIGRVLGVERWRVSLLEIDPAAIWDKTPTEFRLSEITRVDFGGDYENALHLVGSDPPAG